MITPETAAIRARMIRTLRAWLDSRGYLEVDTPLLTPRLIPESYIDPFTTTFTHPRHEPLPLGLVPSPEVWMKQLLTAGFGDIYQLGHVFRDRENLTDIHNPEFTMLEWYTVGADADASRAHTMELLSTLADALGDSIAGQRRFVGTGHAETISIPDAFCEHVGSEIDWFGEADGMRLAALKAGLTVSADETEEELFQRVFLTRVEPNLPANRCVFVTDYPALVPTPAARGCDSRFADRWELYIAGMEIANCYTEERESRRLKEYVDSVLDVRGARTDAATPLPGIDDLAGFAGAQPCSGVALGVDRLLAALLGHRSIRGVIFFPGFSIFR